MFPNFGNPVQLKIFWFQHLLSVLFTDFSQKLHFSPVGIYLIKVSDRSMRTRCEICSKSTIKTPEHCSPELLALFWCRYS